MWVHSAVHPSSSVFTAILPRSSGFSDFRCGASFNLPYGGKAEVILLQGGGSSLNSLHPSVAAWTGV